MSLAARILAFCLAAPLFAQLPFYTDDPAVTEKGKWHFEFFDEFDALQQPQYPNLRQNTANYKVNYGLPHNLELDADAPYLAIYRALQTPSATGAGAIESAAQAASTHAIELATIAKWKPWISSLPDRCRIPPERAMATRDPARDTAPLNPDAVAANLESTDVITSVVIGANTRLTPSATSATAGKTSDQ